MNHGTLVTANQGSSHKLYCDDHTLPVSSTITRRGKAEIHTGNPLSRRCAARHDHQVPPAAKPADATLTKAVGGHK